MWNWILEHWFLCLILTLGLFCFLVFAYLTADCDIVEAMEKIKRKRQRQRNRQAKHKRVDFIVTEKKKSRSNARLM